MLMKDSEEKRSTAWRTVLTVSSVLLVIVAVFFIVKLFTANPLEGTWIGAEDGMTMEIRDDDTMTVKTAGDDGITVETDYSLDKDNKAFTIHLSDERIREQAEESDGKLTEDEIRDVLEPLEGTYEYNIESGMLTLSDREYGSRMVFEEK